MENEEKLAQIESKKNDGFLIKEYEEIRKEIMARLEELWRLEKFALGGAAAIAAWLFVHPDEIKEVEIAWWLPFVFLVICAVRFCSGMYHLSGRASEYLKKIENHFMPGVGGWEVWFGEKGPNETFAYSFGWAIAILAALAIPFLSH